MKVIGTIYKGKNEEGDFKWMMKQNQYSNSLFIFNDNTEYHHTNRKGLGNAIMRQYNKYNTSLIIPRSAGIPTGTLEEGGFTEFNEEIKKIIDESFLEIKELIKKYDYDTIIYSADKNGDLGTNLFEVDNDVVKYITSLIKSLEKN